jgi:spoIIIJ-associated protein
MTFFDGTGLPRWGQAVSQAEDMLSDVPGDDRGAMVSTESADTAAGTEADEFAEPGETAPPGATLDELVGKRGEVLEALQELTRLAVHRQTGERARLMLDVGGYRVRRRAELTEVGRDAADEVQRTGTPKELAAMTPFERKIVHGAVADVGLRSESEGEEPNRRVVVYPAG